MDTEEGDFEICGTGSPEDVQFDSIVGVIEDFMINFNMEEALATVPKIDSVLDDHARHTVYRHFIESVEHQLDDYVMTNCSGIERLADVAALLESRKDELSEEVWEFVSEGCFDYVSFLEHWTARDGIVTDAR